jgi:hypothetical protein
MMHPNWLLLAAVLTLWGPVSARGAHSAEHLARGIIRAVDHVSWHDLAMTLVCSEEGDLLVAECR